MKIRNAKPEDMPIIDAIALKYDLDSNDTKAKQFIVAEENKEIIGFGRLLKHRDVTELGTIGVMEEYRNRGVAKKIINELLSKTNEDVYLTTLIPDYFKKFGFKVLDTPAPHSMIRKAEWCEGCKKTGCTVMKRRVVRNK